MGSSPPGAMPSSQAQAARWAAMDVLEAMHAPAVGFYFLGATAYGVLVLQKPKALPPRRRRIAIVLVLGILTTFIAELLYYLSHSFARNNYAAPRSAVINGLGSIFVWGPLSVFLMKDELVRWNPYFGACVLEFLFDSTICLFAGLAVGPGRREVTPLVVDAVRALLSAVLVVDWFSILMARVSETGTDEEGQSLLGNGTNGTAKPKSNGEYGTVSTGPSDDASDVPVDRNKAIKEQQAKRLEEEGGWLGYLKGFSVFLPYLWPKDDKMVMFCLFLRGLNIIQGRILNVLAPRQLGIITDKLIAGATAVPLKDVALWTFYKWFRGSGGFGLLDSYAQLVVYNKASARVSQMAFKHVMSLSMDFHTNKESGEIQKAVNQASSLNRLLDLLLFQVSPIVLDVGISVWYVTHLFDSYMAFIILFTGLLYAWTSVYFTAWNREKRRVFAERSRAESQVVNETLHNWSTVFYFNRTSYEQTRYGDAVRSSIGAWFTYWYGAAGGHAIQDNVMALGFAGCCVFAMSQIVSGAKPVGNLVTFIMYWDTLLGPLYVMAYSWKEFTNTLIDAERLLQLLNTKPSVVDTDGARPIVVTAGKVEFKDVDFAYDPRKEIIKNVNLTAEGGQTIAFVGETGGGKSTILKLLARAYDVTNGSISIDGQDLRSVTRSSLMNVMGLVPQSPQLFNRSIRENIRYGRLDATDAEIEEVCCAAAIHDTILEFPDGYNSKVGERGVKLSGGQLQRIAIAQVLLQSPKIVLLDEATSAIDSTTESLIQEAFRNLSAGRTTFVIAHRLSTVAHSDQILVVDKGEIIERGTHTELLELGGKYAELWGKQTAAHSQVASKAGSASGDDTDETVTDTKKTDVLINVTSPDSE